jgi:hypothetical protein
MKRGKLNKLGQVWIETVIYTLIAFVMIGLVLSFARPQIEKLQDQAILQQSTEMLKYIDSIILSMGVTGNQRIIELQIKAGDLKIDGENDKFVFELESKNVYSEPGKNISDGSVTILTEQKSGFNLVTLTTDYSKNYNIKYNGKDETKIISKASTPYKLLISNEGKDANGKTLLNMSIS